MRRKTQKSPTKQKCPEHPEFSLSFFCITCKRSICIRCQMAHNGHSMIKSKEYFGQIQEEMKQFLSNFSSERERLKRIDSGRQSEAQDLEEQKKIEYKLLDTKFSDLHTELDRTKENLKERFVKEFVNPKLGKIKAGNFMMKSEIENLETHIQRLEEYTQYNDTRLLDFYYDKRNEWDHIQEIITEEKSNSAQSRRPGAKNKQEYDRQFAAIVDRNKQKILDAFEEVKNDAEAQASRFSAGVQLSQLQHLKDLEVRRQQEREMEIMALEQEIASLDKQNRQRAEIAENKKRITKEQQKLMDELERRGLGEEEMQRLLEQHAAEMKRWEAQIEKERRRQVELFKQRLKAKAKRSTNRTISSIVVDIDDCDPILLQESMDSMKVKKYKK